PYDDQCPRGEKCNLYSNDTGGAWNAYGCFPLDPDPAPPGAPCEEVGNGVSGIDSCEPGAMCWNVNAETNEGHCIGFCDGASSDPTCSEPGTWCYQRAGINGLCLINCDPRWPDCYDGTCVPIPGDGYGCLPDQSGDV